MKIGIVTYYRSHNYGAMLQAVALRMVLHKMGHEATFINYWPQHQKNIYRLFAWEEFWRGSIKGRLRYLKNFMKNLVPKLLRRKNFNRFYRNQIAPFVSSQEENYDVIIYGSDQIWRKQGWGYGYNPVYFGKNNFKTQKHISYAASMGSLPDNPQDEAIVFDLICCLDKISVREKDLKFFLQKQGGSNISLSLDPTFLLSKDDWKKIAGEKKIIKEPYLLFYDLQNGTFDKRSIEMFATQKGLKIIKIIGTATHMPSFTIRTTDGPFEFLNLIFNADYVVTSSFHGLAFSIIFQKPFLVSLSQNKSRVESLLNVLSLSDRLLPERQSFSNIKMKCIDWKRVQHAFDTNRQISLDYLNKVLR